MGGVELQEIDIPVTLTPEEGGKAEPEVRKEILLVEAARVRKEALEARERGDWDAATRALRSYRDTVSDSGIQDDEVEEEARDLEHMVGAFEDQAVHDADVKYMKQRAYSRHRSRGESLKRYRRG